MANPVDKKFCWVIKDLYSLQSDKCYSVPFLVSDCKWRLLAFPKGNNCDHLSLYLDVADSESLPFGWKKYVKLRMTLLNQFSHTLSITKETEHCFDGKFTTWGFPAMLPLSKLHEKDAGFVVNGEVIVVAEVDVFEVIGTFDESEKSEEASELVSKQMEIVGVESEDEDLLQKTPSGKERNNVDGTKHVDVAVKTRLKKKRMKKIAIASAKFSAKKTASAKLNRFPKRKKKPNPKYLD